MLVFWDWNGTLLDDLQYSIGVRNRAFSRLGLRTVQDLDTYYREFTFPIHQYYLNAGVPEEMFDAAAHEWIAEYENGFFNVPLRTDAIETLDLFQSSGYSQVLLSATKHEYLERQVSCYPIRHYFSDVLGLGNIYAKSKTEIAIDYMTKKGYVGNDAVVIGDTLHDAEVAKASNAFCILTCGGHQDREALKKADVPIANSLKEAFSIAQTFLG